MDVAAAVATIPLVATHRGLVFDIFVNGPHVRIDLEVHGPAGLVIRAAGATDAAVVPWAAPSGPHMYVTIIMSDTAQDAFQLPWDTPGRAAIVYFALTTNAIQAGQARAGCQQKQTKCERERFKNSCLRRDHETCPNLKKLDAGPAARLVNILERIPLKFVFKLG